MRKLWFENIHGPMRGQLVRARATTKGWYFYLSSPLMSAVPHACLDLWSPLSIRTSYYKAIYATDKQYHKTCNLLCDITWNEINHKILLIQATEISFLIIYSHNFKSTNFSKMYTQTEWYILKFVYRPNPMEGSNNFNYRVDNIFIILMTVTLFFSQQTREQGIDI